MKPNLAQMLAALLTGALSASTLLAQPPVSPPIHERPWVRVDTPRFTLLSALDEPIIRQLGADLERLHVVLTKLAPRAEPPPPVPTLIYLFDDVASFDIYKLPNQDSSGVGFLTSHPHATYVALNSVSSDRLRSFLYKQYILKLVQSRLPELPLWLRQGLAEYYGTFEADEREVRIGRPVVDHVRALREVARGGIFGGSLIPLGELLVMKTIPSPKGVNDPRPSLFFLQSWALVHYLLSDDDRRERTERYVEALLAGRPHTEAFERAFEITVADLEAALMDYLRGDSFVYLRIGMSTETVSALGAWPLSPADVLYRLGDLLLHTRKPPHTAAVEHFRRALALDLQHGLAHAGLGYAAELAGDEQGAHTAYARAVELAGGDFLVQSLYGESLLRQLGDRRPETEEGLALLHRATAALQLAVELRPTFATAWARLGYAHGLEPEPSEAEIPALERAAELLPDRHDIAFNLLLTHARRGNREAAETVRQNLHTRGADAATLARAREVLLRVEYQEAVLLVRQQHDLEKAILGFARIQISTRDPELSRQAAEQIAKLQKALEKLRFADRFNQAVTLFQAGDAAAAAAIVDELAATQQEGYRATALRTLREALAERAAAPTEVTPPG